MNQTRCDSELRPALIKKFVSGRYCGCEVACMPELESTNFSAKELAKVNYPAGTVVVCDHQISGRGRRDRKWISIPGESICMSIVLRPKVAPENATRYTIAAALGICKAMELYCIHSAQVKWPNDIVVGKKKLSGILLEGNFDINTINYLVVGIGLNVNTQTFFGDIADTATSINQCTGVSVLRERVVANILNESEPFFDMCESDEGFMQLMEMYRKESSVLGKNVRLTKGTVLHEGKAVDFDESGRIILEFADGSRKTYDSGDVTLRY